MNEPPATGDGSSFQQLLHDARNGDNSAREQLYLEFGPYFRRVILRKLKAQRIEWATTPHDIFDAVVLRVWEEDAMYALRDEQDFLKYVSRAVKREVCDVRRSLTAHCRDFRRLEPLSNDESRYIDLDDPVQWVSLKEEIESIRSSLSEQNQQVLEMLLAGKEWVTIGARFGLAAEAVRKRFHRSLAQIRRQSAG